MKYLILIPAILAAFAWSIGGEKYFGKARRSMLLVPVFCLKALALGAPWWTYVAIIANFYTYQALFYDMAIKMIYPDGGGDPGAWSKILGWILNFVNGLIAGVFPFVLYLSMGKIWHSLIALVVSGLGWCFAVWLSNSMKMKWNGCTRIAEVKVWCPADSWWWACWVFGLIIGAI